jgi:hypothetical protein
LEEGTSLGCWSLKDLWVSESSFSEEVINQLFVQSDAKLALLKYYIFITVTTVLTRVSFEVFTVVTMKNAVFQDAMPRDSCNNQEPPSSG